jgi:hypothetical protein
MKQGLPANPFAVAYSIKLPRNRPDAKESRRQVSAIAKPTAKFHADYA